MGIPKGRAKISPWVADARIHFAPAIKPGRSYRTKCEICETPVKAYQAMGFPKGRAKISPWVADARIHFAPAIKPGRSYRTKCETPVGIETPIAGFSFNFCISYKS